MKKYGLWVGALLVFATPLLLWSELAAQEDQGWPREFTTENAHIVVYQPQVETWRSYSEIEGVAAIVATTKDSSTELIGSVRFTAKTKTNFDTRTVLIHDKEILSVQFSTDRQIAAEKLEIEVRSIVAKPNTLSLDRMLAMVEHIDSTGSQSVEVSVDPPTIFYSIEPAILVLFNGEPIFSPIDGTDLMFAINTNWDVFLQTGSSTYFLLNGDNWLTTADVDGPWRPVDKLPDAFSKLPDQENWSEVRKHLNAKPVSDSEVPVVFATTTPTELILLDGTPQLQNIANTQLMHVTNTESDLFLHKVDAEYYFLVSGRWFRTNNLSGPWSYASADLPADFALIPPDHERAHVLASVPGTSEANQAVQQAQVPQQASVNRDEASVDVTYTGEPEFQEIEGSTMTYAVNSSYDVIYSGGSYYCCYQGVWFVSSTPGGVYVVSHNIPTVIYTIPPSYPVHHVTYVRVYSHSSTTVVFGYTSGYMGVYVYGGVVVYGSGYYYPPYVYYGHHYPVYYPYPHSYGVHAYYNPHTGRYARGASVYGPYGGAGRGATYNPHTGTYARGVSAYGPYGGAAAVSAYNPRTGTRAASYQGSNQYAHWGETVVDRGDRWAHSGHYTDEKGTRAGFKTSEGAKGVGWSGDDHRGGVLKTRNDDLYVAKDGNVYRKDGDSWQKSENGKWSDVGGSRDLSDRESTRADLAKQREGTAQTDRTKRGANVTDQNRAAARERVAAGQGTGTTTDRQRTTDRTTDRQRTADRTTTRDASKRQTGPRAGQTGQRNKITQGRTGNRSGTAAKRTGRLSGLNRDAAKRSRGNTRSNKYQASKRTNNRSRASSRGSSRQRSGGRRRR